MGLNRPRHTAASEIRLRFGLEAAQVTLGRAMADVCQIYPERNLALAIEAMRKSCNAKVLRIGRT
jgi:hypothetical protein